MFLIIDFWRYLCVWVLSNLVLHEWSFFPGKSVLWKWTPPIALVVYLDHSTAARPCTKHAAINPPVTDGVGLNTKSWVGCQSVSHNNELKHRPDRARKDRVESHQAQSVTEYNTHFLINRSTQLDQHFMPSTIISQPLCVQNTQLFQKWLQAVTHLLISFFRQIVTLTSPSFLFFLMSGKRHHHRLLTAPCSITTSCVILRLVRNLIYI